MSEQVLQDGDVVVRALGGLRRITLNRPQALNAITLPMVMTMTVLMRQWASDPAVGAVMIDGAGGRALAAGGDIRAIYDAAKAGDDLPARFWRNEYRLNVLIARYAKPVIAIMDGVVMGGGVGLSAHASHRIVTERSSVAMPEVAIGYFPDVGVSYLLARAPGFVGTHVALTGSRLNAADAIHCGLADIHIESAKVAGLPEALADCRTAEAVGARLRDISSVAPEGNLEHDQRMWIDSCYGADDIETIVQRLHDAKYGAAHVAGVLMLKGSPTSLKITLRNLRSALSFERVEQSFQQDYRVSLACVAAHDFIEGIRAMIVDKDRKPAWQPQTLAGVTPEIVARYFQPVGDLELQFED